MAVVKANAYGHGAVQVARVLEDEGVAMLGVALVEEGIELRSGGVKAPILVMGGSYEGGYRLMVEHRLTPTLFRREHIDGLIAAAQRSGIAATAHLKLDTGMSRLGVQREELPEFLQLLRGARGAIELEGFLSHFANADVQGDGLTASQHTRFREGLARVRDAGFNPRFRHLSNSAGLLAQASSSDGLDINLVRPGLLLYGLLPDAWLGGEVALQRVVAWKTGVMHLKQIATGTAVSYGGTWVASRPSVIATLPIGYADGFSRVYSGKASVLVHGQRAPVVGRVTMDMCMVDVTDLEQVKVGDEVVILGAQGGQRIDAEELAALGQTLHYEVLCSLGARVPRLLVGTQL
ncbi:MAG: Alanine racemase, partial [Myxococcaceae bacterium]|nr:Alanine racemase [Myxococcaceae bacterium]